MRSCSEQIVSPPSPSRRVVNKELPMMETRSGRSSATSFPSHTRDQRSGTAGRVFSQSGSPAEDRSCLVPIQPYSLTHRNRSRSRGSAGTTIEKP